jgi:hypothetical protein
MQEEKWAEDVTTHGKNEKCTTELKPVTCFHDAFLFGLCFDFEDGGDMFLRKAGLLSKDYKALYRRG